MAACRHGGWRPFIGSEALAAGNVTRHELRRYYRAVMPNVYLDKRGDLSLRDRTVAARATDFKVPAVEDLADRHGHTRGLRQLFNALDLVDSGAESPRETRCGSC